MLKIKSKILHAAEALRKMEVVDLDPMASGDKETVGADEDNSAQLLDSVIALAGLTLVSLGLTTFSYGLKRTLYDSFHHLTLLSTIGSYALVAGAVILGVCYFQAESWFSDLQADTFLFSLVETPSLAFFVALGCVFSLAAGCVIPCH